jgi:hypothetical protein
MQNVDEHKLKDLLERLDLASWYVNRETIEQAWKRSKKEGHEAAATIRAQQAEIERLKASLRLLASDAFFISGEGGYLVEKAPKADAPIIIYALYSHYAADLEEVPNEWIVRVNEAGLKLGYNDVAMGWVLFRRNQDKLVKIETTENIIAARDWFRTLLPKQEELK